MKFFKNFYLRGSKLYIREFDNGIENEIMVDVRPSIFLPGHGDKKDIFGNALREIKFNTVKEAREFADSIYGQTVWGFDRWAYPVIHSRYDGQYDPEKIRVVSLDIENNVDNLDGFPNVETADCPINAVTISFKGRLFCFTTVDYTKQPPEDSKVMVLKTEAEMLRQFMKFYTMIKPDVITGWNINGYDMPMLYNRIKYILGETAANELSPFGYVQLRKVVNDKGQDTYDVTVAGVSVLDYLELYKKFRLITRESYKLDFIAQIELNDSKVEYDVPFKDFYRLYPNVFVDYNIHDVRLIDKLEKKLGMLRLVFDIAYTAKCNYQDCLKNTRVWDVIIANHLWDQGIVVPYNKSGDGHGDAYEGAFVKDPIRGYYEWLVSFDATSLYPSNMIQYNISPETMLPPELWANIRPEDIINKTDAYHEAKRIADKYDATLCGNGVMFSRKKQGFIPVLADMMFNKRKEAKGIMLGHKKNYEAAIAELERRGLTL
jgi:DNA polymerase elongation subunit (family B)